MPSVPSQYVLAIDLGTSGPKVALVSTQGEVVASEFEPTPFQLLPHGGAEQDPHQWWGAITRASQRLLGQYPALQQHILAVACTSQWSGTVAVDETGQPLMNAIIWMDARGAPHVRRLTGGPIEIEGYAIDKLARWLWLTGGIPGHAGKDSIAHILYLKHERPEIYRATHKFLEPKDYLNFRLTGQLAASYDSIALHWVTDNRQIQRVVYDPGLLRLAGLERRQLPDLKRAADILGPLTSEAATELGLGQSVPVVMGTPDLQSAAIGSGAVRDFEPHLYLGTSAWLTCHVPFKKTDIVHNMVSLPAAIPDRYFIANEQEMAGACLTYLRDNLLFPEDAATPGARPVGYAFLDQIAERAPAGSDKLIFTPWLYGERTPVEDHTVRGAFYNLSLAITRPHLVRAVLEGVAYNARWLLGAVEQFAGRKFEALHLIGGGAQSGLWCQIHADILNRPIRQVKDPIRANARGVAWLALVALGRTSFAELAERVPIAHTYQPNPEHRKLYDELFREFVAIYDRNKGIYARLNRHR